MYPKVVVVITWFGLLNCFMMAMAVADAARPASDAAARGDARAGSLDSPDEPANLLPNIQQRRTQKDSLLPVSPLRWLHKGTDQGKQAIYDALSLKLGLSLTHLFQVLSEALPGEDQWGTATTLDFVSSWEILNKGTPTQGELFFLVQGRWDYGTTGPGDLGAASLGSLIGTANTFSAYDPTFLLRNIYWRQGSPQAGWAYRIGKISPDALLSTSAHIAAPLTFLPTASSGPFSIALPDSGLGVVGGWYINDRVTLVGLGSDANGDRFNFGDIGAGDFFVAGELHVKIAPRTPKAGYSKFTVWHTDGTQDGQPSNGMAGPSGWGFFIKHEQELTADGQVIGILRYGRSFDDSAFYKHQASVHVLLYDPPGPRRLRHDLIGMAFNWVVPTQTGSRNEYSLGIFYRLPLFPSVDFTFYYQSIFTPVLDPDNDQASVFSFRIRTSF